MATDCIIENWIMKNKTWLCFLFSILLAWVVSVIGVMLFKYWYFDLSWSDSRISLSNILSLGSAIGAIAVAIFAWLAYRSAIDGYKKQATINEITKAKINHQINIITKISSTLGSVQELFIEARGKNKIAMETAYTNFDEIITSTVEQNKLINSMNVKLNSSINKMAGLQIETFIFYSALQISEAQNDAIKNSIMNLTENLRQMIHSNKDSETKSINMVTQSMKLDTEQRAITALIDLFNERDRYFKNECNKLVQLISEINQHLKLVVEVN